MAMKISNETIGKRTRDLPACSAVPKASTPQGTPNPSVFDNTYSALWWSITSVAAWRWLQLLAETCRSTKTNVQIFGNKSTSPVFTRPIQQLKCSNNHVFLINATCFGHHHAVLQKYERWELVDVRQKHIREINKFKTLKLLYIRDIVGPVAQSV